MANELLEAISATIDEQVNSDISDFPFVSIVCDESTDISNAPRMIINARIINPRSGKAKFLFLQNLEYEDGSGEGLCNEILHLLKQRGIPTTKISGLGTDGASVMTGQDKGVAGRMKRENPHILNIYCLAHRLALCTSQAASGMSLLKNYQEWLTQLFYYFKRSAQREQQLHKIQALLDHPTLKYREIHAVRWMSFFEALDAVYRPLDPLLTYLHNRQASKDPAAKCLLKFMASSQFFYINDMMMDIIPIVSKLCPTFQSDELIMSYLDIVSSLFKLLNVAGSLL